MSHRLPLVVPLALLLLGAALSGARADGRPPVRLEALVPADTHGFLALHDLGAGLGRLFGQTPLGRLAREPEMAAFLEGVGAEAHRALEATERGSPEGSIPGLSALAAGALRLLGDLDGEAALAWIGARDDGTPVMAGVLDFGPHLQDFLSFLTRASARREGPGAPALTVVRQGPTPRFTWQSGGVDSREIHGVAVGTALYLSNDAAWVDARALPTTPAPRPPLAGSAVWTRAQAAAGFDGATVTGFLDLPPGDGSRTRGIRPLGLRTAFDLLGMGGAGLLAYGCRLTSDGFTERLTLENAGSGLLSLFGGDGARLPRGVPRDDPFLAFRGSLRVADVLPRTKEVLTSLGRDADGEVEAALDWVASHLHVDPVRELLFGLSGEVSAGLAMPEAGGLYPEVVVALGLRDPKAFEALLTRATESLCETLSADESSRRYVTTAIPFHGVTLHVLEGLHGLGDDGLGDDGLGDHGSSPGSNLLGSPTWVVLGDRLLWAPVPHALKEMILREQASLRGALRVQGSVPPRPRRPGQPRIPEGALAAITVDAAALETLLYDTATPLLQSLGRRWLEGSPVRGDPALLPPTRVVSTYLQGLTLSLSGAPVGRGRAEARLEVQGALPILGGLIALAAGATLDAATSSAPPVGEGVLMERTHPDVDPGEDAKRLLARVDAALEEHVSLHGFLPKDLRTLVEAARLLDAIPLDPWQHPLRWVVDESGRRGVLTCLGPDGFPDTGDDVSVEVDPLRK